MRFECGVVLLAVTIGTIPLFADSQGRTGLAAGSGTATKVKLDPAMPACRGRDCQAYKVRNDAMDPPSFRYSGEDVLPRPLVVLNFQTLLCDPTLLKKDIRRFDLACILPQEPTSTQVLRKADAQVKFAGRIYQAARKRVQQRLAGCFSILWTAATHDLNRESIPVELRFSNYTLSDTDACR